MKFIFMIGSIAVGQRPTAAEPFLQTPQLPPALQCLQALQFLQAVHVLLPTHLAALADLFEQQLFSDASVFAEIENAMQASSRSFFIFFRLLQITNLCQVISALAGRLTSKIK
jgi:hypothetical protein